MQIHNIKSHSPAFKGYDARKLQGFVMNSNFGGIADEMKRIGNIENFKVFLFQENGLGYKLTTNYFGLSPQPNGCWAQDYWGVVNNTLLSYEESPKTNIFRSIFDLKHNPKETEAKRKHKYNELAYALQSLQKVPIINHNGEFYAMCNVNEKIYPLKLEEFNREVEKYKDNLDKICRKTHIKGGNYFIVKGTSGKDELIIGKDELKKFKLKDIKKMFDIDNIHVLPQADFHLDLFMCPLKDKKVLIADDNLMVKILEDTLDAIKNTILSAPKEKPGEMQTALKNAFVQTSIHLTDFQDSLTKTKKFANMTEVKNALGKAGFKPISVPGRFFTTEIWESGRTVLRNFHNYLNAHTLINNNDELVYITNKSKLDKQLGLTDEVKKLIGFSAEKASMDTIKPHVDKVYEISGNNNEVPQVLLQQYFGGIHCAAAELPNNLISQLAK